MKKSEILLALILLAFNLNSFSQNAPNYSTKEFFKDEENRNLLDKIQIEESESAEFIIKNIEIWDVDDNNKTHIKFNNEVKICFVGKKSELKDGIYKAYIFLKSDNTPIKIWEQSYENGKLNGLWKTYNLRGTIVRFQTFRDDVLMGVSRTYDIDGKTMQSEVVYENNGIIEKEFYRSGTIKQIRPYKDSKLNGEGTRYYEDGTIMEKVYFTSGEFHGVYTYYYPNGKKWLEIEYKNGTPWTAIGNYFSNGQKRNSGTLKNGEGTLIYYHENGSINEVHEYKNGIRIK